MSHKNRQEVEHEDDAADADDEIDSEAVANSSSNVDPLSSSETAGYHEILNKDTIAEDTNSYSTIRTAGHVAEADDIDSHDATQVVHEMHLLLLYLMSHPEEFQRAAATLEQWNAEYGNDNESLYTEATNAESSQIIDKLHTNDTNSGMNSSSSSTPLPYAVFCDDAEVVLPQAHTASQLFGLELSTGMELEAAAGVPALSQLFLRWLGTSVLTIVLRAVVYLLCVV